MPSPVRFPVVKRILESNGWVFYRTTGFHHVFKKPGVVRNISVPVHRGMGKHAYVAEIKKQLQIPPSAD